MKKFYFSFILMLLFLGCQTTPQEPAAEPETVIVEEAVSPEPPRVIYEPEVTVFAEETLSEEDSIDTAPVYIEEDPGTTAVYHFNLGNEYYNRYLFDEAINEFNEAIRIDPIMAEAYIARGNTYSGRFEFERALDNYSTAAWINPDYDNYAMGYSYFLDKNYRSAVNEFSQAIANNTNLLAAYNDRGLAYANMNELDRAIADFDEAVRIEPNSAFAYNNRGNASLLKGDLDKAIEDYSRASDLYSNLVFPYSGRGLAYYRAKAYDNAIADYTRAIDLTPGDYNLYISRGDAYRAKGEAALAENDYAMAAILR